MLARYGFRYFRIMPGVYGDSAGDYSAWAMNSASPHVATNWHAIDGGSWWLRDTPYSQPSGNYEPGCWLGLLDPLFATGAATSDPDERYSALLSARPGAKAELEFDDNGCTFQATDYVCSTNDKDPTVPFAMWLARASDDDSSALAAAQRQGAGAEHTGARPGRYKITYQVHNSRGIPQCEAAVSRLVIVQRNN